MAVSPPQKRTHEQLALIESPRWRVYRNRRCLCDESLGCGCWCARCVACGEPLTKHAFTEQDAHTEAEEALDMPGHFQHRCKR